MNLKVFFTSSIPKFSAEQYTHGRMLNKSLLLGSISFPLNPEVIKEFNMKNQCLEIGIVLLPFFYPLIKSYSTVKAWLKSCIIWEVFLGAGPFLPDHFL